MNYGPGHDGFVYNADTFCVDCGETIINDVLRPDTEDTGDSNDFPQPIFFGESDYDEYCAHCGELMWRGLDEVPGRPGEDYSPESDPLYRRDMRDAGRGRQLP